MRCEIKDYIHPLPLAVNYDRGGAADRSPALPLLKIKFEMMHTYMDGHAY
jgi:hypothetical protein